MVERSAGDGAAARPKASSCVKTQCLVNKIASEDVTFLTAQEAVEMATIGGARAMGIDHVTGSLEVGKRGDVIIIDLRTPHVMPRHDDATALAYCGSGRDVRHVYVDGSCVVRDRELQTIDLDDILDRVEHSRARVDVQLENMALAG